MSIPDPLPGLGDHWNSYPEALQRLVEEIDEEAERERELRRARREVLLWRALIAALVLAAIAGGAIALAQVIDNRPHLAPEQESFHG